MADSDERRRHTRVRLGGRVEGQATMLAGFRVVALSEKRATLEMGMPVEIGSTLDVNLHLSHVTVELRARVVQVEPSQTQGAFSIGVEFEDVQPLDQALLESFLDREREKERTASS